MTQSNLEKQEAKLKALNQKIKDEKNKIEYILDSHGNKTKTPAGNVRNRKIWLVDWDKKEKIRLNKTSVSKSLNHPT